MLQISFFFFPFSVSLSWRLVSSAADLEMVLVLRVCGSFSSPLLFPSCSSFEHPECRRTRISPLPVQSRCVEEGSPYSLTFWIRSEFPNLSCTSGPTSNFSSFSSFLWGPLFWNTATVRPTIDDEKRKKNHMHLSFTCHCLNHSCHFDSTSTPPHVNQDEVETWIVFPTASFTSYTRLIFSPTAF